MVVAPCTTRGKGVGSFMSRMAGDGMREEGSKRLKGGRGWGGAAPASFCLDRRQAAVPALNKHALPQRRGSQLSAVDTL
eukprot:365299-Chlamydomonas_euryale.AAC.15